MIVTEAHLLINRLPEVMRYSDRSTNNLLTILPLLPASNTGIFEFRIFPQKESVDYAQPVPFRKIGDLETLYNRFVSVVPHSQDSLMWEKLRKCIQQIKNRKDYLQNRIETIWLEYDNEKMERLLPSLFFTLHKDIRADLKFEVCNQLLSIYYGCHSPKNDLHIVEDLIKRNHLNNAFFSFGIMLPRQSNEMKLVVGPENICNVNEVLIRLPCGDNYILPDKFLNYFHNHAGNISISITNGTLTGISVELICLNNKKSMALKDAIEKYIIAGKITDSILIKSFLHADKTILPSQTQEDWPDSLILKSLYSEHYTFPRLDLYFNHVKVCFRNKTLALLKAYLYYRLSYRDATVN